MKRNIIFTIVFYAVYAVSSNAADFTQHGAEDLFYQVQNVLKSRDNKSIESFFKYYIASDAIIYKKSILVSPNDLQNPKSIKDMQYDRDKYIKLMQDISNIGVSYDVKYTVDSFQALPDKYLAYVSVNIVETSTLDSRLGLENPVTLTSSNCNYTMVDGIDSMKIAGANCIEKIILSE